MIRLLDYTGENNFKYSGWEKYKGVVGSTYVKSFNGCTWDCLLQRNREHGKTSNTAKNIFSLLIQNIIKAFTTSVKLIEHKLLHIQIPLLLARNVIPRAKQLKYKQTSATFDQIWLRI